ncbi:MAG TPA: signal peptidase I [Ruminococcus sp.]|nr:signal peptidase I [Ruminococcus sp.]
MNKENKGPPEKKGYAVYVIFRKIIVYLFCVGIVIASFLFASSKTPNKSLFGYRYYTVITPSMTPAYNVGDMVFVKIEKADGINVGDVITFNPSSGSDAYLTHRVTQKLTDYQGTGITCFRTKGDANDSEDSFLVDEDRVIGKVKLRVPKLGYVVRFIQLRWYFIIPLAVMLWLSLRLMKLYFSPKDDSTTQENTTQNQ